MQLHSVVRPHIIIITPLGLGLDESAIDTISKKWDFVPASQNGVPVECDVVIMVEFNYYP